MKEKKKQKDLSLNPPKKYEPPKVKKQGVIKLFPSSGLTAS